MIEDLNLGVFTVDYERLKIEVAEISKIASSVPDEFRDSCFELLLKSLLASTGDRQSRDRDETDDSSAHDSQAAKRGESEGTGGGNGGNRGNGSSDPIPLQAQMRVFLAKTNVTQEQLSKVLMMDGHHVHFVREPTTKTVAAGQIEWSLLLALKNGIEVNKLEADPEAVRSICQDKGFYDRKNFASYFKRGKAASYFKGAMEPQGSAQGLTSDGQDALGALVKSLAGAE